MPDLVMGLLEPGDAQPVIVERAGAGARFLLVCDHAGRETPVSLGRMGLPDGAFDSHIAWDIGTAGVARGLSALLGATCIMQRYSRLVIDCNRDPAAADAVPAVSDSIVIPANQGLSPDARRARVEAIHAPYHAAVAAELDQRQARDAPTILVFLHSFTPRLAGVRRPWRFGIIREPTSRFSEAVLDELRALDGVLTGDNAPYAMDGTDYSAPTHALARGLDYLELEMRQDFIVDPAGQAATAERLAGVLTRAATRV